MTRQPKFDVDIYGRLTPVPDTTGMLSAVRCTHCFGVYDQAAVTVTDRRSDCSMWKAPCCGRTVDDRGETGWKTFQDYVRLNNGGGRR